MQSKNSLFICNKKFLDSSIPAGGVKFCTDEFLTLIKIKFTVIEFPVEYKDSLLYRFKKKFQISSYEDYKVITYENNLRTVITANDIKYVFLNLTNTAPFAKLIKSISAGIKIILCSHGNESGDFLHSIVTHNNLKGLSRKTATYNLGNMLINEAEMRKHIDLVLTVSEVEEGIEKWIGAKKVYMAPRFISKQQSMYNPEFGKVGFISDLSHEPNFFGINEVCKALLKKNNSHIQLILCGSGKERGQDLQREYPFIRYLGYLDEVALSKEVSSWTFSLNPVFYYSRGVSTKLGKSLGMGYPVITSEKGLRGYKWKNGDLPKCNTAEEMAELIHTLSTNIETFTYYKNQVEKIQDSAPSYEQMMIEIEKLL